MTDNQKKWADNLIGRKMRNQMSGRVGEAISHSSGSRGTGVWFTCKDEKGEFTVYRSIPKKLKST